MNARPTRRDFLKTATAAGAGLTILADARLVRGAEANEKLGVALVGVGGRGNWFVRTIPSLENVVALCDVDQREIDRAFAQWAKDAKKYADSEHSWERKRAEEYQRLTENRPRVYHDFRKMLDEMHRLDAVVVATPDHSHAVISAGAIRAGKGVFCEKPLTRTVHESRALRELGREHKVATQMGNQGMASGEFRRTVELIWDGAFGEIEEVHVWNGGGGSGPRPEPTEAQPVPEGFDWDLWLGPAAMRPYHRDWIRRHLWREFGTAQLGNWGSHTAALAFKGLKLDTLWYDPAAPKIRVEAEVSEICRVNFPKWEIIHFDFPARGDMPPARLNWYSGGGAVKEIFPTVQKIMGPPAAPGDRDKRHFSTHAGSLLVGEKGYVYGTGHSGSTVFLPEEKFADLEDPPQVLPRGGGPEREWFAACRGGTPGLSNFDYSGPQTELLMLGNVATQFEGPLEYDPAAMKITNNAEADALLRSEYREGWRL